MPFGVYIRTEEYRKKLRGIKRTESTRERISESKKGILNPMFGKVGPNFGKSPSKETRDKLREALLGRRHSEVTKIKMRGRVAWNRGLPRTKEERSKISESIQVGYLNGRIVWNKGKQVREDTLKKWIKSNHITPNSKEKKLNEILEHTFPGKYKINVKANVMTLGGKVPDFVNVDGKKSLIELYGDFWHKDSNPQERIDFFRKFGWDCLVIWEHELENIPILVDKISRFSGGN